MKNNNRLLYLLIALLAVWMLILSFRTNNVSPREAEVINEYEVSGFSTDFTKVIDEAKESVVTVQSDQSIMSGFVFLQDGDRVYVLTCCHGLVNASSINVTFGLSYSVPAVLTAYDIYTDLALLEFQTPYEVRPLRLGDADELHGGEFLVSIGTPGSLEASGSVKLNMVANKIMTIDNVVSVNDERHEYYLDVVAVSGGLSGGYSGSPLLNMNGELVGMNMLSAGNDLNYALTVNEIRKAAEQLLAEQKASKIQLGIKGVYIKDMANFEKNNLNIDIETISGMYLNRVREDSPAYAAGLRNGDILLAVNGIAIGDLDDLLDVCYGPGESLAFDYIHNGEQLSSGAIND